MLHQECSSLSDHHLPAPHVTIQTTAGTTLVPQILKRSFYLFMSLASLNPQPPNQLLFFSQLLVLSQVALYPTLYSFLHAVCEYQGSSTEDFVSLAKSFTHSTSHYYKFSAFLHEECILKSIFLHMIFQCPIHGIICSTSPNNFEQLSNTFHGKKRSGQSISQ